MGGRAWDLFLQKDHLIPCWRSPSVFHPKPCRHVPSVVRGIYWAAQDSLRSQEGDAAACVVPAAQGIQYSVWSLSVFLEPAQKPHQKTSLLTPQSRRQETFSSWHFFHVTVYRIQDCLEIVRVQKVKLISQVSRNGPSRWVHELQRR